MYEPTPHTPYGAYQRERPYILSAKIGAILILIGVILTFVGFILISSVDFMDPPDESDYDMEDYDKYSDDMSDYYKSMRKTQATGKTLAWIGLMFVVVSLYIVGVAESTLPVAVRVGLIASVTVVLAFSMIQMM